MNNIIPFLLITAILQIAGLINKNLLLLKLGSSVTLAFIHIYIQDDLYAAIWIIVSILDFIQIKVRRKA
jgi:hypothetical protein